MKHVPEYSDDDRADLLLIYSRLQRRFGFDRVIRHMEQGRLVRAANRRIQEQKNA